MLPEVRMARIIDAIGLHQEAVELRGSGTASGAERAAFPSLAAHEAHGAEGLVDRRRGRASGRRAPVDEIEWVVEEFRTRYFDFTAKHFHEAVRGRPMPDGRPFGRGYTWTKSVRDGAAVCGPSADRGVHASFPPRSTSDMTALLLARLPMRAVAALPADEANERSAETRRECR
jgi:hypothetical protein